MTEPNRLGHVERLGELLRSAVPPPSRQEHLEGRARLIAQVVAMRRPNRVRVLALAATLLLALTAMAAAAVALRGPWARRDEAAPQPMVPASSETAPSVEPPAAITSAEEEPIEFPDSRPAKERTAPMPPKVTWRELVARGESQRVVREAKAAGFDDVLRTRPVSDLRALGDAIRYSGERAQGAGGLDARGVYEAIRRRFPAGDDARVSAFVLGRLSEEQANRPDEAIAWYTTYLQEAASGPFAGDALGRKMMLVARRSGRREARTLAMDYLRLYPHGSYEKPALDLTR